MNRTERDISALQQSGVPVWAEAGRTGGYCLDKERTLPPVNFTPGEAMALAVALQHPAGTPFSQDGAAALRKVLAAMRKDALAARRVLRIGYADRHGPVTRRDIEPLGYVGTAEHWYLLAWCRLRGAVRAFRTDRITAVTVTSKLRTLALD